MKLESNTIGDVEDASEDDVRRAFENREPWDNADWAGNVYALIADDGAALSAISGAEFQDFSVTFSDASGTRRVCPRVLPAQEVADWFVAFLGGDTARIGPEAWPVETQGSLFSGLRRRR